jgi:hypothetical protein
VERVGVVSTPATDVALHVGEMLCDVASRDSVKW